MTAGNLPKENKRKPVILFRVRFPTSWSSFHRVRSTPARLHTFAICFDTLSFTSIYTVAHRSKQLLVKAKYYAWIDIAELIVYSLTIYLLRVLMHVFIRFH